MRRSLIVLSTAALALCAPVADAASKKAKKSPAKPKILRAALAPVTTDARYARIDGRAQLVDGKKNDVVSVHVRRLPTGVPFTVSVLEATVAQPCAEGAAAGADTAFAPRTRQANSAGNLNTTLRSRTFSVQPGTTYVVDVRAGGVQVVCGVLKPKKAPRKKPAGGSGKGGAKKPSTAHRPASGGGKGRG